MKNFRKVLALVLVVATLFSFAAMASAATYKDADKISYNEAVNVLSHVGILEGYPEDGTFRPANTITRAEMAKMIAVMANAGYDVKDLFSSDVKFADSKEHWAASYIAYCTSTGIVAGRSATTFDPQGKVTGLETAKMLLVVLGFDAQKQGYVGADWKLNVKRDAKLMGLLENFAANYNPDAAITREEAAQMMLNALEAPCVVGYLANDKITVTNAIVFKNLVVNNQEIKNAIKVVSHATLKDALQKGEWALYGNVLISDTILGEQLFGLKRVVSGQRDCYGRPSTGWTYKSMNNQDVNFGTAYANSAIFTSDNTNEAKMLNALAAYKGVKTVVYIDGKLSTNDTLENALKTMTNNNRFGKGVRVEAYYEAAATDNNANGKPMVTIVVINTYITTIESINTAYGTFTLKNKAGNFKNTYGFKPANVGDVVLAWFCGAQSADLHNAKLATPVTVTPKTASVSSTAANNNDHVAAGSSFVTKDGKKYEYAANLDNLIAVSGLAAKTVIGQNNDADKLMNTSLDLFLDESGFVMGFRKTAAAPDKVAVVEEGTLYVGPQYTVDGKPTKDAHVDMLAFEPNVPETEKVKVDHETTYRIKTGSGEGTLVTYGTNAKGEAVLTAAAEKNNTGVTITSGKAYIDGLNVGATDTTKWIVRTRDFTNNKYVYTYFEGKKLDKNYKADSIQYFATNGYLDYVYVEATQAAEAHTAFILGKYENEINVADGGMIYGYAKYKALVNGKEAVVASKQNDLIGKTLYTSDYVLLGLNSADGLPIYVSMTANEYVATATEFEFNGNTVKYTANNGTVKFLDVTKDTLLVMGFVNNWDHDYDGTTAKVEYQICSIEEMNNYQKQYGWQNAKAQVIMNADGTAVAEMYIVLDYVQR